SGRRSRSGAVVAADGAVVAATGAVVDGAAVAADRVPRSHGNPSGQRRPAATPSAKVTQRTARQPITKSRDASRLDDGGGWGRATRRGGGITPPRPRASWSGARRPRADPARCGARGPPPCTAPGARA